MKKIYNGLTSLLTDAEYVVLNYIVNHIPCWTIRKLLYRLCGMKIGTGSRIAMGTKVVSPHKISIGDHCIINEMCYLDGRGGLTLGNNVSVSIYTVILTASHKKNSRGFDYYKSPVVLEDRVWTGSRAIVLDGAYMEEGSVLGAGSVLKGRADQYGVYAGVPAIKKAERSRELDYTLNYRPFFR